MWGEDGVKCNWVNLFLTSIKVWSNFVHVLWGVLGLWISFLNDPWIGWVSNSLGYTSQSIYPIVGAWGGFCCDDHKLVLVSSSKGIELWVSLLYLAACEQVWTIF